MEILFFNKRTEKFHQQLQKSLTVRADRAFQVLSQFGYEIGLPYSRALGDSLFELRVIGQTQVRFIYTFYEGNIFILHGFIKKTEQIPNRELAYARKQLSLLVNS